VGRKRKFTVRRDPRDISVVHFWDPEAEEYFRIPYRNTTHPAISMWELKEIRRQLRQQGRESVNEDLIFSAYARMREIADTARRTTKAARRDSQRRLNHSDVEIPQAGASAAKAGGGSKSSLDETARATGTGGAFVADPSEAARRRIVVFLDGPHCARLPDKPGVVLETRGRANPFPEGGPDCGRQAAAVDERKNRDTARAGESHNPARASGMRLRLARRA